MYNVHQILVILIGRRVHVNEEPMNGNINQAGFTFQMPFKDLSQSFSGRGTTFLGNSEQSNSLQENTGIQ